MEIKKPITWRSKPYLKWLRSQRTDTPPQWIHLGGENVPAHQGFGNKGMSKKAHDSYAMNLTAMAHNHEHCLGEETFWGGFNRERRCVEHVCRYLDEKHNLDGWRKALELLTEWMIREQIK